VPSAPPASSEKSRTPSYQVDDLTIDVGRRSVSRGGFEIPLPALSFDLLLALVHAAPNLLTYDQLMAQVWSGVVVNSETITQRVKLVRDALDDDPQSPRYIAGVRGRGYRLIPRAVPLTDTANEPPPGEPANAPASETVAAAVRPRDALPGPRSRIAFIALAASVPVLAALAWLLLRTGEDLARERRAAGEVAISVPRSIAVLPFVDMSEDKSQEYFADGISEELIGVLAKIPQLTVIGRTSSFSFKGQNHDMRQIGEKLGVAHVVEGSVRRSGARVRISAQLVDARSGAEIWSGTYDRDLGDVLVLQAEIASGIARSLQLAVGADVARDGRPLRSAEAYTFFLRGRAALDRGDLSQSAAKTYFQQALALDPEFARAQEALALAYQQEVGNGLTTSADGWAAAVEAARKTLRLDPTSAMAHAILGLERTSKYDWKIANAELEQALALEPHDPYALLVCSWLASDLGRLTDARKLLDAALVLDPLNPDIRQSAGYNRLGLGDLDGAERELRASLQISPTYSYSHRQLGRIQLLRGQPEAALEEMQAEPRRKDMGLALAYHSLGRKAESDAALARLHAQSQTAGAFSVAFVHAYRNEIPQAFEWLDKAVTRGEVSVMSLETEPVFEPLRSDPRYQTLLQRLNFQDWPGSRAPADPSAPPPR